MTGKKKILLVTPYLSYYGGVEVFNFYLLESIAQLDVEIITAKVNFKLTVLDRFLFKIIGLPYLTYLNCRPYFRQDCLFIANGEFAFGLPSSKTLVVFHGSYYGLRKETMNYITSKYNLLLKYRSFFQWFVSKNKTIVAVSSYLRSILIEQRIHCEHAIQNCIDTIKFCPNYKSIDTRLDYIFIGSYNKYSKGFDILESIADQDYCIKCITNYLPPESNLVQIGPYDNSEIPNVINKFRIMIFPSRFEGFGLAPLEALACGVPVIMTTTGIGIHLRKYIPDFVVLENSAENYTKQIKLINQNYLYYSNIARDYAVKHYSINDFSLKWNELIRGLLIY